MGSEGLESSDSQIQTFVFDKGVLFLLALHVEKGKQFPLASVSG